MSMVQRLIEQLKRRGLSIEFGNKDNVLLLCGPAKEKTPEVLDAVKKFKPELLKLYAPEPSRGREAQTPPQPAAEPAGDPDEEACAVCGRITDAEDRDVLATNHYLCELTTCPSKVAARRNASRRSAA